MRSTSAEQIAALDEAIRVFRSGFMSSKGSAVADQLSIIRDRLVSLSSEYDRKLRERDKLREVRGVYREDRKGPYNGAHKNNKA
jgi:hypothetical protein